MAPPEEPPIGMSTRAKAEAVLNHIVTVILQQSNPGPIQSALARAGVVNSSDLLSLQSDDIDNLYTKRTLDGEVMATEPLDLTSKRKLRDLMLLCKQQH